MISFRAILVAADFSETSRDAFRAACALARVDKTRLIVLHVLEPNLVPEAPVYFGQKSIRYVQVPRDPSELKSLKEQLRDAYTPGQPLDVEYRIEEGVAAEEIVRAGDGLGCDLIVIGTHGRSGVSRVLAGSVAETVLRKASCPVLALRHQEPAPPREPVRVILHPTDFSPSSEAALRVARLLAREHGARLVILHVTPLDVVLEGGLVVRGDPSADRNALEALCSRMDGTDLKYPVELRLDRGDAAAEILRAARDVQCSLIVMGTHGRSGLSRLLMGSVAEAVLRGGRFPVMTVKLPWLEPAPKPVEPAGSGAAAH
jgi:nucleotide-binding universal stress UspA family protein